MKNIFNKIKNSYSRANTLKLDPNKPNDRKTIVRTAVEKTVREYGKALEKLGND